MKAIVQRILFFMAAMWPVMAPAQTYTDLFSFSPYTGDPFATTNGAFPYCGLVLSSNVLYGTSSAGGTNGQGVIFSVNTDGSHFTDLHTFGALSSVYTGDNTDGAKPYDTLLLYSNQLYGTASIGGTSGFGTIFRINTDGTLFTNLHNFTDGSGGPRGGLIVSNNVLYGTTLSGGTGDGSVFRIDTDGLNFTNLHSFTTLTNDALAPAGGLVLSGSTLYGTTSGKDNGGEGVVFSVSTGGKGYTNLFSFQTAPGQGQSSTNTTGAEPYASLLLLGSTLYGTTLYGGTNGNGVIFAINTNGSGFTNLHTFGPGTTGATNVDGVSPEGQLLLVGGSLYGTAANGGFGGYGTVFAINTNGSNFRVVYQFVEIAGPGYINLGGDGPAGGVILSDNTLYGTTDAGGGYDGNIYSLNLGIPLMAQSSGGNLILTWANAAFSLQAAPGLAGNFTNIPNATSPYTNVPAAGQQFFRLQAN
jgi:uncharacterized repeat protein (TIGR03803 family)